MIDRKPISWLKLHGRKRAQEGGASGPGGAPCRQPVVVRTPRMAKLIGASALLLALTAPAASAPAATSASAAATGGTGAGDAVPVQYRSLTEAVGVLGRRTLRRGARGADVVVLQRLLRELKYKVPTSGFFEGRTQRAVKSFQRSKKIQVVGFVGPQTARALKAAHAAFVSPPTKQPAPPSTPPPAVQTEGWVFPIRGKHDYGDATDRYGADRGDHAHAGQDVLAACGLTLVAARGGKVVGSGYGGGAGNFVAVHTLDTRYDYFYAHLRDTPLVKEGQTVKTGQIVGYVGQTGDAYGCHLHIELWDGLWWNGGKTIDPLPFLKAWDK
jgi:murein DD-endopeptidase MepM/ murein hydrolase activator NlpD